MTTLSMNPTLLLLFIALLYILVFGGLSLMRREGLSVQFAIEAILLTAILVGLSWALRFSLGPVVLLLILYIVTMRSRLLTDLANVMAQRDRYGNAFKLYELALRVWPDRSSRLVVMANRGAAELHSGDPHKAIATFEEVLDPQNSRHVGRKYEAATRFNLAVACDRAGQPARATQLFCEVAELLPGSLYARGAEAALKRRREAGASAGECPTPPPQQSAE